MDNKKTLQTVFMYALFALFFILLLKMLHPFFTVILWTALLYIIIHPLFKLCDKHLDTKKKTYKFKRSLLAGAFSVGTMLIIFSVLALLVFMLIKQMLQFLKTAEAFVVENPNFLKESSFFQFLSDKLGMDFLDVELSALPGKFLNFLRTYSSKILAFGTNLVSSIGSLLISVLFVVFALFFCFLDGKYLASLIAKAIPIDPIQMSSLMSKFVDITRNLFSGYLLVALYQGGVAFILMLIFGVEGAFLFSVILMFCTFVPIFGAAIVWFPMGIVICLTDSVVKGIVFMILAAICVSCLDNLLRPLFLKDRIQVHPLVIFFAILGGLKVFGLNGLLLGPMIVILFFTVLDMLVANSPAPTTANVIEEGKKEK